MYMYIHIYIYIYIHIHIHILNRIIGVRAVAAAGRAVGAVGLHLPFIPYYTIILLLKTGEYKYTSINNIYIYIYT